MTPPGPALQADLRRLMIAGRTIDLCLLGIGFMLYAYSTPLGASLVFAGIGAVNGYCMAETLNATGAREPRLAWAGIGAVVLGVPAAVIAALIAH